MTLERGKAEAVIRKIAALRALTVENGATVAEAAAASRMAKRLMQKNDLTEDRIAPLELDDYEDDEDESPSRRFPVSAPFAAGALAMAGIAAVVALLQFTEPTPADPAREGATVVTALKRIAQGSGISASTLADGGTPRGDVIPAAGPAAGEDAQLAMVAVEPSPVSAEAAAATLATAKVYLHFETDAAEAQATRLAEILRRAHVGAVEFRPVEIKITQTHVRYFARADRDAAQAALALLGDAVSDPQERAAIDGQPRDFSSFTPPPPPNTIEIWMSSL